MMPLKVPLNTMIVLMRSCEHSAEICSTLVRLNTRRLSAFAWPAPGPSVVVEPEARMLVLESGVVTTELGVVEEICCCCCWCIAVCSADKTTPFVMKPFVDELRDAVVEAGEKAVLGED